MCDDKPDSISTDWSGILSESYHFLPQYDMTLHELIQIIRLCDVRMTFSRAFWTKFEKAKLMRHFEREGQ